MRQVKKAAVLGAGVMGTAIAAHLANAGLQVLLLDRIPDQLDEDEKQQGVTADQPAFRDRLATRALQRALKAKPAVFFTPERAQLVRPGNFDDDLDKLTDCDWVVEAIVEDPAAKADLFARVVPYLGPDTILSTNTSGIPVNRLAEGLPEDVRRRFLLTHFFNPPRYMRLLEIVPCHATAPKVVKDMAVFLGRRLGKGIVYGKDTPNFVGNRIGVFAMFNAMHHMQALGLSITEVDAVAGQATARPKSGVFRTADMVGIDTLVHVGEHSWKALPDDEQRETFRLPPFLPRMVAEGLLGDKAGRGFYRKEKTAQGTRRLALDLDTLEYRPVDKPDFPCLAEAKTIDAPGARLSAVLSGDDPGAEFAWRNLRDTLIYAVNRIPEIADDIEQVDNAMRWGFNWELGPFAMLDAIGVERFVARAEADGVAVPGTLREVPSFYRLEDGRRLVWDLKAGGSYRAVPEPPGVIALELMKSKQPRIAGNDNCSLLDLGDGVFGFEFHAKMNSISPDMLDMLISAVETTEVQGVGLVLGNQGAVFSAGANLAVLARALADRNFDEIGAVVSRFQQASMALKYARVPVVAAPFNLTLGGACEFCLHADAIVAHAETYMGLVEVGVGILPAGGGCKEMAVRAVDLAERFHADVSPYLFKAFENIGMAKVSSAADELFALGYLRRGDSVTMDRARLLGDAKRQTLALAGNYRPQNPATTIKAPGRSVAASLRTRLWNLAQGDFISAYDQTIGSTIAGILTGGDVPAGTEVSEDYLLELEREGFLSLIGNPETLQRIEHMLKTGKPLRN